MTIPIKFRKSADRAIASYNFTDIASGLGYERFYGLVVSGATAEQSILTDNITYSYPIEKAGTANSASDVIVNTQTFENQFKLPRIIKGKAFIAVPTAIRSAGNAGYTFNEYVKGIVQLSGSTVSTLISGASITYTEVALAINTTKTKILPLVLEIPQTHFKINDVLKITIEQHGYESGTGSGGSYYMGFDPKNRAGTIISDIDTNLIADVPFKIDL